MANVKMRTLSQAENLPGVHKIILLPNNNTWDSLSARVCQDLLVDDLASEKTFRTTSKSDECGKRYLNHVETDTGSYAINENVSMNTNGVFVV
jgi:hypothetical protein